MKGSRILFMLAILLAIGPVLAVKLSLWLKYKDQRWVFHTSKVKWSMNEIDSIILNGVKTFRYTYCPDSVYLEYNALYENKYLKSTENGNLSIAANDSHAQKIYYPPPTSSIFSLLTSRGIFPVYYPDIFTTGSDNIVFHGPVCPVIRANNTSFYIESVAPNGNFDFDLDFSTVYWENYFKGPDGKFDKKITTPWYLNQLDLKLNKSNYYLLNDLHFNKLNIKAIGKTNLDIDSDYYKEANIEVDPTVILRAPVSIWNNLKLKVTN